MVAKYESQSNDKGLDKQLKVHKPKSLVPDLSNLQTKTVDTQTKDKKIELILKNESD